MGIYGRTLNGQFRNTTYTMSSDIYAGSGYHCLSTFAPEKAQGRNGGQMKRNSRSCSQSRWLTEELQREADAAHELLEARIGAQGVIYRLVRNKR